MPRAKSKSKAPAKPADFADLDRRILAALDLRAEFTALGVEIVGDAPSPKGFVPCRAVGRDDGTPSAGVNLLTGRYKDHGGDGVSLSFWDFAAAHGDFSNWRAAREHYANKAGVPLPKANNGHSEPRRPVDDLRWLNWNAAQVGLWCRHKPGVTVEAVEAAGGRLAKYREQYVVVCLPAWGGELLDADPCGYVIWNVSGKPLPIWQKGESKPSRWVKMKTVGGSRGGLMNRVALDRLAKIREASQAGAESPIVWKVEGPTDAMALQAVIPEDQQAAHVVLCNSGGANEHPTKEIAALFAGCRVCVIHDADRAGESGATEHWLPALAPHAAELRHVRLPFEISPDHGKDLRDYLNEGGSFDELLKLAEDSPIVPRVESSSESAAPAASDVGDKAGDKASDDANPDTANTDDPRAAVVLSTNEHQVNHEVIAALANCESIYQRSRRLVLVDAEPMTADGIRRASNDLRITEISKPRLRSLLTNYVRFQRWQGSGEDAQLVDCHPPEWCVQAVHSMEVWPGVRVLRGIVETPVLRPDGSVLQEPGYDEITGLMATFCDDWPAIPNEPSQQEALEAIRDLGKIIADFPFSGIEDATSYLCAAVTPFAKHAYSGNTPMFLADANMSGSGKGLLFNTISMLAFGRSFPPMSMPSTDDELRKQITSWVLDGTPAVLIDNVHGVAGGQALEAMLTAEGSWSDRQLGSNKRVVGELTTTLYLTGNNITVSPDTLRRIIHCRLRSTTENPEERSDFENPELLDWVKMHRKRLVAAALTILRAYAVAGRPAVEGTSPMGSFSPWCRVVRDAVCWLGAPDPVKSKKRSTISGDTEKEDLLELMNAWRQVDRKGVGMTTGEAIAVASEERDHGGGYANREFRDALIRACPTGGSKVPPSPKSLGKFLKKHCERIVEGMCFSLTDTRANKTKWAVVNIQEPESNQSNHKVTIKVTTDKSNNTNDL